MALKTILLDTNAYVAFKQGQAEAVEIVQRASRLAVSSTVLGMATRSTVTMGTSEQWMV